MDMAREVTVTVKDDIDGTPGAEPVRFGLDGTNYVIDLADANAARLRDALVEFIAHAQVEKAQPSGGAKRVRNDGNLTARRRTWWRENDGKVEGLPPFVKKGRIPAEVQALADAHGVK
jgi:hypothetical protein